MHTLGAIGEFESLLPVDRVESVKSQRLDDAAQTPGYPARRLHAGRGRFAGRGRYRLVATQP
jgi:hypothetical protein